MQWMYDAYVTQDDDALANSDAHLASGLSVHFASQRQCDMMRRGHQHSSLCVDNTRMLSE